MGEILEAWPAAVGAGIARNAWPARFQRDGTLIVHTHDAVWAFELTTRAAEIGARLPGRPPLRFLPGPLPEAGQEPAGEASPRVTAATPGERSRAAAWAAGIEDEELRSLVARAAAASLSRRGR